MKRKYLLLLLWLALLPLAAKAGSGAFSGTVRDAGTNLAVSGAIVSVKMEGGGKLTVSTDSEGRFMFSSLPAGDDYALKVTKDSYEDWKGKTPKIKAGEHAKKEIALARAGSGGGAAATGGGNSGGNSGAAGGGSSGGGSGGGDGVISGVVSSNGEPVRGATVKVGDKETKTESDGSYRIKVPAGNYPVVVKKDGFKKFEATVSVTAGSEISGNVQLQPKK